MDEPNGHTLGGLPLELFSTAGSVPENHHGLGEPGMAPYARGIHRTMYTQRRWTMRHNDHKMLISAYEHNMVL